MRIASVVQHFLYPIQSTVVCFGSSNLVTRTYCLLHQLTDQCSLDANKLRNESTKRLCTSPNLITEHPRRRPREQEDINDNTMRDNQWSLIDSPGSTVRIIKSRHFGRSPRHCEDQRMPRITFISHDLTPTTYASYIYIAHQVNWPRTCWYEHCRQVQFLLWAWLLFFFFFAGYSLLPSVNVLY